MPAQSAAQEAQNELKFPEMNAHFVQYQTTIAEGREQYRDIMPPYWVYESDEGPLPSDIVKEALSQVADAAANGKSLSPLEQLGLYLLKLKAVAEYVEPEPEEQPSVTTRVVVLVEAKHYSAETPEKFVAGMSVGILPSVHATTHRIASGVQVLNIEPLEMSRVGPAGTLGTVSVRLSVTLEVVVPYTVDVRNLLDDCRAVLKSRTEALPPIGFPLLDITIV